MRVLFRSSILFGALSGFVPVAWWRLYVSGTGLLLAVPWYPLLLPLAGSLLLSVRGYLLRGTEGRDEDGRATALLWAVLLLLLPTASFVGMGIHRYKGVELYPGEWSSLLSGVIVLAMVSLAQAVWAGALLLVEGRGAVSMTLVAALLIGTGGMAEFLIGGSTFAAHRTIDNEMLSSDDAWSDLRGEVRDLELPVIGEESVRGVRVLSRGVLLVLADGVLVVDPHSGDELWRYRRPEVETSPQVVASWKGDRVLVEMFLPSDGDGHGPVTVRTTHDSLSGEILHRARDRQSLLEYEPRPERPEEIDAPPLEGEEVVVAQGRRRALSVLGSSSGAPLWDFDRSEECRPGDRGGEPAVNGMVVTDRHVLVLFECEEEEPRSSERARAVLHAFDATSGRLLWTHGSPEPGGAISVSSDGSSLYLYEPTSAAYTTLDTVEGVVIGSGTWAGRRPVEDHWDRVTGSGVLLEEGGVLTLTDAEGRPGPEISPPEPAEGVHERLDVGDRFLHTVRWEEAGRVELTRYAWVDGASTVVPDVLGRRLGPDEHARVLAFPDVVVVYAVQGAQVTSVSLVT
ncbi:hypothetical protein ACFW4K_17305 [Nocardiopsis alba]|uniref:hypothetical protein n=1 Tax=Nocardiopsis alba TaxID=53437 RepID=UPI003672D918